MSTPHSHPHPEPSAVAVPPRGGVADFPPIFAAHGRGGPRLRRALYPRRRVLGVAVAVAAAGATTTAARTAPREAQDPAGAETSPAPVGTGPPRPPGDRPQTVSAPVRIADAAAVRLLRPGDRVDVIATGTTARRGREGGTGRPRVVARSALVERIPEGSAVRRQGEGALIVLEVSRRTATELAGAAAASGLAVALC